MTNTEKSLRHTSGVEVLENIPVKLEIAAVMRRMLFRGEKPGFGKTARELIKKVKAVAHPRALYKLSLISNKTRDSLEVDRVRFCSYMLRTNLDKAGKVFPWVATCGVELEELTISENDPPGRKYCLEMLKSMVLTEATEYLKEYLTRRYRLDYLFSLSPGEYQAWPLINQAGLVSILGDVESLIGVSIAADGSARPSHTTSGLFFYAKTRFENCQLCAREPCMMRRAPFSPELVKRLKLTPHTLCAR